MEGEVLREYIEHRRRKEKDHCLTLKHLATHESNEVAMARL
jgi:hypothetical protein